MPTLPQGVWTFDCPACGEPVEWWSHEPAYMMRTDFGPRGVPEHALIVGDQRPPGGYGRWTMDGRVNAFDRTTMHPCGDVILGPWEPPTPPVALRLGWAGDNAARAARAAERAGEELRAIVREAASTGMSNDEIAAAADVHPATVAEMVQQP